jgi:hypothetical protein
LKGVSSTGFQDDSDISAWLKPYVATALLHGYIKGISTDTGALFQPEENITLRDACIMLNSVLEVTDVVSVSAYVGSEVQSGAQAVANLTASRVMLSRWDSLDDTLTRAQAAELLQKAITLLEKR